MSGLSSSPARSSWGSRRGGAITGTGSRTGGAGRGVAEAESPACPAAWAGELAAFGGGAARFGHGETRPLHDHEPARRLLELRQAGRLVGAEPHLCSGPERPAGFGPRRGLLAGDPDIALRVDVGLEALPPSIGTSMIRMTAPRARRPSAPWSTAASPERTTHRSPFASHARTRRAARSMGSASSCAPATSWSWARDADANADAIKAARMRPDHARLRAWRLGWSCSRTVPPKVRPGVSLRTAFPGRTAIERRSSIGPAGQSALPTRRGPHWRQAVFPLEHTRRTGPR